MAVLVTFDPKQGWGTCTRCGHKVNPDTSLCEEAMRYFHCFSTGCVVPKPDSTKVK